MKAVIFAAGKGTRLKPITDVTPKTLLKVGGFPIIGHILKALPKDIDEIIVVTGHLENKVKDYLRNYSQKKNIPLRTVSMSDSDKKGTAAALWAAKPFLKDHDFIVLYGDDIVHKKDVKKLLKQTLSFGFSTGLPESAKYLNVKIDNKEMIVGLEKISSVSEKINIATGSFKLDSSIFKFKPVKLSNGEYGLPQTIMKMAKKRPVYAVKMDFWIAINSHKDLRTARKTFKKIRD